MIFLLFMIFALRVYFKKKGEPRSMHPVITYLRHRGIAAVLAGARVLHRLTGGRRPKFLFSENAEAEYVGSSVRIVEEDETSVTIAKYRSDGTIDPGEFTILTTTDLHLDTKSPLTRGGSAADRNNKSLRMLVRQIKRLRPDLVIFTGDVNQSDFQQIDAVQLAQLFEKLGVYWAYAFGNHEAREEKGYYKYLMYKGFQYGPHCLCRFGDPSLFGYGNFAIHIKNSETTLAKSLYLFDSGRDIQPERRAAYGLPEDLDGYDFLKREQIAWYLRETEKTRRRYGPVRTMVYLHIPLPEYAEVFGGNEEQGFALTGKAKLLYGGQNESVGCSPYNSGFFEAAVNEGSLQAVFAGHDHVNDFCAGYRGVLLVYSQCGGYNTYSMEDRKGWPERDCHYGVTLTTLLPDGALRVSQEKYAALPGQERDEESGDSQR